MTPAGLRAAGMAAAADAHVMEALAADLRALAGAGHGLPAPAVAIVAAELEGSARRSRCMALALSAESAALRKEGSEHAR
jgi:hypothetical protein